MNEETQIYLDELVEAVKNLEGLVEAVDSPDWWSIAVTFFAAVVAAWITWCLGKRQNELQEQQLKLQEQQNEIQKYQTKLQEQQIQQQEYDLYRKMYTRVFELDFFNKTMLHRIVVILTSNEDNKLRLKLLDDTWQEYEKQSEEFGECTLDMDLKQCGEGIDAKYYFDALQASRKVILMFKYFVEEGLLIFNPLLAYTPQVEDPNTKPKEFIDIILSLFRGSNPQLLENELLAYASIVEKTNQAQLLKVIKERIISNDTK